MIKKLVGTVGTDILWPTIQQFFSENFDVTGVSPEEFYATAKMSSDPLFSENQAYRLRFRLTKDADQFNSYKGLGYGIQLSLIKGDGYSSITLANSFEENLGIHSYEMSPEPFFYLNSCYKEGRESNRYKEPAPKNPVDLFISYNHLGLFFYIGESKSSMNGNRMSWLCIQRPSVDSIVETTEKNPQFIAYGNDDKIFFGAVNDLTTSQVLDIREVDNGRDGHPVITNGRKIPPFNDNPGGAGNFISFNIQDTERLYTESSLYNGRLEMVKFMSPINSPRGSLVQSKNLLYESLGCTKFGRDGIRILGFREVTNV